MKKSIAIGLMTFAVLPALWLVAAETKEAAPVRLLTVPDFCEGVVVDEDAAVILERLAEVVPEGEVAAFTGVQGTEGIGVAERDRGSAFLPVGFPADE